MKNKQEQLAFSIMDDFVHYRVASQSWCNCYDIHLKAFSAYCKTTDPNNNELTQQMIDSWCKQRDTELNNSCRTRIYAVINLVDYINSRVENPYFSRPHLPRLEKNNYIPHAFTNEELRNFFYACDTIQTTRNRRTTIFRKIMMPVMFRLLYSTGMRTTEVRLLKRKEVNLENGVINIQKSKGYNQHYVVMHDSMLTMMKRYDKEIQGICPSRTYFFPTRNDKHYTTTWITLNFNKLWYQYNDSYANAYALRHHYAITNINSWTNIGIEFTSKLLALSRSMGHASIKSTMYYYSLVPGLRDKLEELTENNFNELIPEMYDEE
ncbi:tyrosine-type recombinase/integrase [Radiobacillus sp. PE A8.2]|uniref:tyrosine-type recombinase/integrase n=1 Tax=Radiobacillus sp. PE A8.2 TaxID=3380349 RepID=UPI00388EDD96